MDRTALKNLLPCYVCGDLPPDVHAVVDAEVRADPELQALAAGISATREACRDHLGALAGELPELVPSVGGRWTALWGMVAAAAVALALLFGTGPVVGDTELMRLADQQHGALVASAPSTPLDPAEVNAAFVDAGLTASLAMVPDLRPFGLQLIAFQANPGGRTGSLLVYEKDGVRFTCQMYTHVQGGDMPVATKTVAGHQLRAYQHGDMAVVAWEELGMTCLMTGPVDAQTLLAMVETKVQHGAA